MALSITSVTLWNQASCSSEPARLTMTLPGRPLFGAEAELHLALRYNRRANAIARPDYKSSSSASRDIARWRWETCRDIPRRAT
jgi:hypothetical protein